MYIYSVYLSLYPTSLAGWLADWLAGWLYMLWLCSALLYACFCALWLTMTIIPNSVRWLLNDFVLLYFNSTTRLVLFCSAEWSVVEWSAVLSKWILVSHSFLLPSYSVLFYLTKLFFFDSNLTVRFPLRCDVTDGRLVWLTTVVDNLWRLGWTRSLLFKFVEYVEHIKHIIIWSAFVC